MTDELSDDQMVGLMQAFASYQQTECMLSVVKMCIVLASVRHKTVYPTTHQVLSGIDEMAGLLKMIVRSGVVDKDREELYRILTKPGDENDTYHFRSPLQ